MAESTNGIDFLNNQVALTAASAGGTLDAFPEGHAVLYLPGRNISSVTAPDPSGSFPFIMYYRYPNYAFYAAYSADGYTFTPNLAAAVSVFDTNAVSLIGSLDVQPVQVLKVAQNDLRMLVSDPAGLTVKYLVSSDAANWYLFEDPIANVGTNGSSGSWNDLQNYYASAAYLGGGSFYFLRGGLSSAGGGYRCGAAFGTSAFYTGNDIGQWAFYSPFNDWAAEGWLPHTSTTGGVPSGNGYSIIDHVNVDAIQNAGTVTIKDLRPTGSVNFNLVHDAALSVPFTFEYRAKFDSTNPDISTRDSV